MPPLVLFTVGALPSGGTEHMLAGLARRLRERGRFASAIVNLSGEGALGQSIRATGVPVFDPLGRPSSGRLATHRLDTTWRLRTILRRLRPAILQTTHASADHHGRLAALGLGIPVLVWEQNTKRETKAFRRLSRRRLARRTTLFLAQSPAVERAIRDEVGDVPIRLVGTFIDPARFPPANDPSREAVRSILGAEESDIVVGAAGRLVEQKNFPALLESIAILLPAYPRLRLAIAGSGPLDAALRAEATRLGIEGRVSFLGHRTDLPALYRGFDIFCLSSSFCDYENVALEAMYAGLPCVLSTAAPVSDDVRDEAVKAEPTAAALAAGIRTLLEEPERARDLGTRARAFAEARTLEPYVERMESIYTEVLAPKAAGG
ncbi:MAG: glycosyltransferase [Planctomycetota bacterium]